MNPATRYKLLDCIYESHRSRVVRAVDVRNNENKVILKILNEEYPGPEALARFRLEFALTHGLAIPGVIQVHGLEQQGATLAMVLEDFGGISLDRHLKKTSFTIDQFLELAIPLAAILGRIHDRRITHKDLNPANMVWNAATGEIKIIDFGLSTSLERESLEPVAPELLEGTLAYLSPEQTGRMHRDVDYRADLYSLGATFFELLTGKRLFQTDDPLELVHCHVAKMPPSPTELQAGIPSPLSAIILKLLAKDPEDRYQSALGVQIDLEQCRRQWSATGDMVPFPLGREDALGRFRIPQKLYGRAEEVTKLQAAFAKIRQGAVQLLVITGYSGIGKTAMVRELYQPVAQANGLYAEGKFDQYQRDIPYGAITQALRHLMRQILSEKEARLAVWREIIRQALQENGQVMATAIPELISLLGPQKPLIELDIQESENRFFRVFQKFLAVLARAEHPLVLFLDDLQWADLPSLKLIKHILLGGEVNHFLLIWAYRDNEVGPTHPVMARLEELQQTDMAIEQLTLTPLPLDQTTLLVTETLYQTPAAVASLARICQQKSGGNPFFLRQFLTALHDRKIFRFQDRQWQWEMDDIDRLGVTTNVALLVEGRIRLLPETTQRLLQLAACIGATFDLDTLAMVSQTGRKAVAEALWPALDGLIVVALTREHQLARHLEQGDFRYRFSHDRLQEAAYHAIDEAERAWVHLTVGRRLLAGIPAADRPERLFDIVNHLNLAATRIDDRAERLQLAELNLLAARQAKMSAAFHPAFVYLTTGMALLGENCWQEYPELAWILHLEAVRMAAMVPDFAAMERLSAIALDQVTDVLRRGEVLEIKIQSYQGQNRLQESLNLGLLVLDSLGYSFPREPDQTQVGQSLRHGLDLTRHKTIEDLTSLPAIHDPQLMLAMRIIAFIVPVTVLTQPGLFPLTINKAVEQTLQTGIAPSTAVIYAGYSIIMCSFMAEYDVAYNFGKAALLLAKRPAARQHQAEACQYANFSILWKEHIHSTLQIMAGAYETALETGQYNAAGFASEGWTGSALLSGHALHLVEKKAADYVTTLRKIGQFQALDLVASYQQMALNLMGKAENPLHMQGTACDGNAALALHLQQQNWQVYFGLLLNKMFLAYLFGNHALAHEISRQTALYKESVPGTYLFVVFHLLDSLTRLALVPDAEAATRRSHLDAVSANQKMVHNWAEHAPMNFLHKYHLVEAESLRVQGHHSAARDHYDLAIRLARDNAYLSEEALALELAGGFYHDMGWDHLAGHYVRDALHAYQRWGAMAKVRHLEKKFPQYLLRTSHLETRTSLSSTKSGEENTTILLDLPSVIRASQVIFSETNLPRLLERLMLLALENAGAERGCLVLVEDQHLLLEVEADVQSGQTRFWNSRPLAEIPDAEQPVPPEILYFAMRTLEAVVLDDAGQERQFAQAAYIATRRPKSVLCVPLVQSNQVIGAIYLENNLLNGAFPPRRVEMMRLMGTQAAMAIATARYTTRLLESQAALTHSREKIRELAAHQEEVRETEKKRLAGEVHDELGSLLTRLNMDIGWLKQHPPTDPDDFVRRLATMESLTGQVLATIRHISHSLRPRVLDQFGLLAALEWLTMETVRHTGLSCRVSRDSQEVVLDEQRKTTLFRIAQEALTNAVRHARARHVVLALYLEPENVKLQIIDDGCGIDPHILEENKGFGINGMRERAAHRHGRLDVEQLPHGGTRVTVLLPRLPEDRLGET
ncbi:MAG: AAA family ATPase [Magnetococcus sp. DMHC-1]